MERLALQERIDEHIVKESVPQIFGLRIFEQNEDVHPPQVVEQLC